MARNKGDGNRIHLARLNAKIVQFSSQDWDEIYVQARIKLTPEARRDLIRIMQAYAQYSPASFRSILVSDAKKELNAWISSTNKLRKLLGDVSRPMPVRRQSLSVILRKHFSHLRYSKPYLSNVDLAFILQGSTLLAAQLFDTIPRQNKPIDFWLVWAALVISVLRKHDIRFARYTKAGVVRKEFEAEAVNLIEAIQQKLPNLTWARSDQSSIRRALRKVVPYARKECIPALIKILRLWGAGDFECHKRLRPSFKLRGIDFSVAVLLSEINDSKRSLERERISRKK